MTGSGLTEPEADLLREAAENGGAAYNTGAATDAVHARMFRAMTAARLVVFTNAAAGGWVPGMWSAHLTYVGWNALFRHYGDASGDRHIGSCDLRGKNRSPRCPGSWLIDGTCGTCGAVRPLDEVAYQAYLGSLDSVQRDLQVNGPRLLCPEHGRMRRRHITTKKVCMLAGTDRHDGGLNRL